MKQARFGFPAVSRSIAAFVVAGLLLGLAAPAMAANLALNKTATGSTSCNANETPAKAVNGSVSGGNSDKFCSAATTKWLQVDLGSAQSIGSFTIQHAGAGGESTSYNTKAYNIQVSSNGTSWTTVVSVSNNTASTTSNPITATSARYVKLNITTPTQTTDNAARIYELEVYPPGQAGGGTVQVFDHIPQYGIYVSTDPANYTPPPGVLMWSHGTEYARKLSVTEKDLIGDDVALQITYHAQCDNYDRFASVFYISLPAGTTPTVTTARTTLVDFISPFSDAWQGTYANHAYPSVAIASFASALADPDNDVWVGISGGSNPYSGDPCDSHSGLSTDYKAVGFLYSLALVSTQTLTPGGNRNVHALMSRQGMTTSTFTTPTASPTTSGLSGVLMVSMAGYGSAAGGQEYTNTTITFKDAGNNTVASFSDKIDCSSYAQYSPDGNPGIFQNNNSSNPRSWCPGAIVPTRFFNLATLPASIYYNVTIGNASPWVGDSNYRTSVNVIEK